MLVEEVSASRNLLFVELGYVPSGSLLLNMFRYCHVLNALHMGDPITIVGSTYFISFQSDSL